MFLRQRVSLGICPAGVREVFRFFPGRSTACLQWCSDGVSTASTWRPHGVPDRSMMPPMVYSSVVQPTRGWGVREVSMGRHPCGCPWEWAYPPIRACVFFLTHCFFLFVRKYRFNSITRLCCTTYLVQCMVLYVVFIIALCSFKAWWCWDGGWFEQKPSSFIFLLLPRTSLGSGDKWWRAPSSSCVGEELRE